MQDIKTSYLFGNVTEVFCIRPTYYDSARLHTRQTFYTQSLHMMKIILLVTRPMAAWQSTQAGERLQYESTRREEVREKRRACGTISSSSSSSSSIIGHESTEWRLTGLLYRWSVAKSPLVAASPCQTGPTARIVRTTTSAVTRAIVSSSCEGTKSADSVMNGT